MTSANYLLAVGSLLFTLDGCGGVGVGVGVGNDGIDDGSRNDDGEVIAEKASAASGTGMFHRSMEFDVGTSITSESNFTGNLKAYLPDGEAFAIVNGEISGSFVEREQISGTSRFEDGTPGGTFLYNYDPTYEIPSSLNSIAGLYSGTNEEGNFAEVFTIDASGAVTGFDADGCVVNGDIKLVDTRYTIYEIQLVISACETDRNISGLAAYLPGGENDSDSLITLADDGSAPVISILSRQSN